MPARRLSRLAVLLCATLPALNGLAGSDGEAPAAGARQVPAATPVPAYMGATYAPRPGHPQPSARELTELGRRMFFDPSLSASGRMSCASCHAPARAYGPPNALAVQLGGPALDRPGPRAVPSLRYLQTLTAFSEHYHDNDGDDSVDAGPTGGHMWDGRASSKHAQAGLPLLSPDEMANASVGDVARKLQASPYAPRMREVFGADVFDTAESAFHAAGLALETFQQSPADFYPFSSKYDAVLRGQAKLSPAQARGLALFNAEDKGNCASCHISSVTPEGAFPLFTDFGLIALGVPRNRELAANADPAHHDLGLCGPLRTDLADHPEYCGLFRTPTLRNVALRRTFFHNGRFHSLEEAVRFYAQRDTRPARWYPRDAKGRVRKFDDLPPQYHGNVNMDPPFGGRPGGAPALSDAEVRDIVAFLGTLTDADLLTTARPARKKTVR
ncbi:MAG: cytochrome c peroxidase [Xenophilus sp.]